MIIQTIQLLISGILPRNLNQVSAPKVRAYSEASHNVGLDQKPSGTSINKMHNHSKVAKSRIHLIPASICLEFAFISVSWVSVNTALIPFNFESAFPPFHRILPNLKRFHQSIAKKTETHTTTTSNNGSAPCRSNPLNDQ